MKSLILLTLLIPLGMTQPGFQDPPEPCDGCNVTGPSQTITVVISPTGGFDSEANWAGWPGCPCFPDPPEEPCGECSEDPPCASFLTDPTITLKVRAKKTEDGTNECEGFGSCLAKACEGIVWEPSWKVNDNATGSGSGGHGCHTNHNANEVQLEGNVGASYSFDENCESGTGCPIGTWTVFGGGAEDGWCNVDVVNGAMFAQVSADNWRGNTVSENSSGYFRISCGPCTKPIGGYPPPE